MKTINLLRVPMLLVAFLFFSCEKDELEETPMQSPAPIVVIDKDPDAELKIAFGKSLGRALGESQELRQFIKSEALKQFDNDYDVLYQLVKDHKLSNGLSFEETLLTYADGEDDLNDLKNRLPLLTLFVPELPEGSFSAESWNAENIVPEVALSLKNTNDVLLISASGEESVLEGRYIPAFPVIVVKDNERVKLASSASAGGAKNIGMRSVDGVSFEFTHPCFNNLKALDKKDANSARLVGNLDQKLIDARNLGIEWQRDYIYYNLTPQNQRGAFSYDFMEHITNFKFVDGRGGMEHIANQGGDPMIFSGAGTGWTDGQFEFRIIALVNGKITRPELNPLFIARGQDLFDVVYRRVRQKCGFLCWRYVYVVDNIISKDFNPNVPIINWDLDTFSAGLVIKFEEYDISEVIQETISFSSKFATNFEISGSGDIQKVKVGFKFGGSFEETTTQSHTRTYTVGSDYLGETTVNFGDNVIVGEVWNGGVPTYLTRDYSTGIVIFSIEPKRVQ